MLEAYPGLLYFYEKLLDAALTLFSEKGYGNVYVGHIADAVGIKAPSLYKHYKSKQDIFDAILEEMKKSYEKQAGNLGMNGNSIDMDGNLFSTISEDKLVEMGTGLFLYFLHDDYTQKFRKMLTIEQFHNSELAGLYSKQYLDDPLQYQTGLFSLISTGGNLKQYDSNMMALQFYSPIYMLLTLCDRQPDREPEALQMLEQHIRQFSRVYKEEA